MAVKKGKREPGAGKAKGGKKAKAGEAGLVSVETGWQPPEPLPNAVACAAEGRVLAELAPRGGVATRPARNGLPALADGAQRRAAAAAAPGGFAINWIDETRAPVHASPRAVPYVERLAAAAAAQPPPLNKASKAAAGKAAKQPPPPALFAPRPDGVDVASGVDAKAVERCWLMLRSHFETADDPAAGVDPHRVAVADLYRFLERSGESFAGGFSHDSAKWAPLDAHICRVYGGRAGDARISLRPTCAHALAAVGAPPQAEESVAARLLEVPLDASSAARHDEHAANAPDADGERPLIAAVRAGRHDEAVRLLALGAWPGLPSLLEGSSGATALHYAAMLGDARIMKPLLEAGADPNARTQSGDVPLAFLSRLGADAAATAVECANVLFPAGAVAEGFVDERNVSVPIPPAAGVKVTKKPAPAKKGKGAAPPPQSPPPAAVPPLQGGPPGAAGAARFTPLHCAAAAGHVALVDELLRRGAHAHRLARQPADGEGVPDLRTPLVLAHAAAQRTGANADACNAVVASLRNHLAPLYAAADPKAKKDKKKK
ncbi:hypothetical protein M885DRAFT_626926 [Pelagophyceae sp. CCMP2097]|nr:hypothetical protein M885DRAFT_626926 [Pelagophyceae sp. CCMP2097]